MDRMIYTALNALAVRRDTKITQANNLANQTVPGFRRDLPNEGGTRFLQTDGIGSTRAFRVEDGPAGFSDEAGFLNPTGEALDVAIADEGYFYAQPQDGEPSLTRRGDLRVGADGILRNGAGDAMLDVNLAPQQVPPFRSMLINGLGEVRIEPMNGVPGETQLIGTLATVVPGKDVTLRKSLDGRIRVPDGALPPPNQQAEVLQGTLEGSNVNPVEELISSIEIQREFELGVRMMSTAKEMDEAGARLMRAPE
ncbi:flagellar biosynthesis protein FlgF [Meridianimarinicoccus roseus]|uniref:Flagellar basal-body rod protein FlgF n=1 Tax=Meridianimarinicoccus roseus TaxID=2072018 RepID=A0A2V2LAR1_9RHOB|nr:flagellar basal body rod C-terminal domain-containing protein [Meridianimarinicoccus roseus]PWR02570.1 flagellar biosynthesis protein FlgF [Meridianimarinicoccus roseus]